MDKLPELTAEVLFKLIVKGVEFNIRLQDIRVVIDCPNHDWEGYATIIGSDFDPNYKGNGPALVIRSLFPNDPIPD